MTVDLVSGYGVEASPGGLRYEYVGAGRALSIAPSSGPVEGGTQVTVLGRWDGRGSTMTCRFGAMKTSIAVLSSSSLRCAAPASVTHGPVQLAIEDSGGATGTLEFMYQ